MQNINEYIEHTNLKPTVTYESIETLVEEAVIHNFIGICVPPYWAKKARRDLGKAPVQLVTVVGFPFGYQRAEVKMQEIESALKEGVNELDIVINISAIKCNAYAWIKQEMAWFSQVIHAEEAMMKVILETAYLNDHEIREASKVCVDAGVDFMKTSTGYAPEGAKVEHIRLLRDILPDTVGIKASGGIRSYEKAQEMIIAGADRIGTSSGIKIVEEALTKDVKS
ncbi:deoxyribose-phosphate aldolase [Microscilla marina]|uniref:Deoxyribose-phosphate aldolase n=1 Tax=Microscilla marina ATCC 23134 TaxID=313606 RepID=A1ZG85_MICM2|nr:deoxyribose-phosphate aldolase [Microscilla marina]EAY30502.1 deoxyribose-phosphate aldolase [Microscilla marina ATCC 23134]